MKKSELITLIQMIDGDPEITFTVYGHAYNPTKQRLTHGPLELTIAADSYGDRVLYIGNGLPAYAKRDLEDARENAVCRHCHKVIKTVPKYYCPRSPNQTHEPEVA